MNANEFLAVPLLRDISTAVARERNVGKLLGQVLEIAENRLGMVRGTIALLTGDELGIEASARSLNAEERALGRYRIGEGVTGLVAKTGHAEVVPDVRKATDSALQRGCAGRCSAWHSAFPRECPALEFSHGQHECHTDTRRAVVRRRYLPS